MTVATRAAPSVLRGRTSRIIRAGLLTAVADGLFGIAQYILAGIPAPAARFFQGIARVVIGPQPMHGGTPAVALGVVLHLCVACFWSALFAVLLGRSSRLRETLDSPGGAFKVAVLYGPMIWTVMSFAVMAPLLRRIPALDGDWWIQFVGHVFSAGLPIALTFRTKR